MTFVKDINVGIIQAHSKGIGPEQWDFTVRMRDCAELHILHGQAGIFV